MNIKQKKGFTLLEIIIVIIIVGVLASLALPRFFSTVEFSRSTEALTSFTALRQSMERCYLSAGGTYTTCNNLDNLDLENPSNSPGHHFTYSLPTAPTTKSYTLQATRGTLDGGTTTDWIRLFVDSNGVTRKGTGKFVGIK